MLILSDLQNRLDCLGIVLANAEGKPPTEADRKTMTDLMEEFLNRVEAAGVSQFFAGLMMAALMSGFLRTLPESPDWGKLSSVLAIEPPQTPSAG